MYLSFKHAKTTYCMFVCWTKLRLFWPLENLVLESSELKEHCKVNIISMEHKQQFRIVDHLCLPARKTCAILSCALQEQRELWDRAIYMHAGKATNKMADTLRAAFSSVTETVFPTSRKIRTHPRHHMISTGWQLLHIIRQLHWRFSFPIQRRSRYRKLNQLSYYNQ